MTKRIFVGNLSYQTTESDLTSLFTQVGPVESVDVITDKFTGRPRGFAFVEMDEGDAEKAIVQLNGTDLGGRALTVNEARPRPDNQRTNGGYGRRY